jgi:hypothetical protein
MNSLPAMNLKFRDNPNIFIRRQQNTFNEEKNVPDDQLFVSFYILLRSFSSIGLVVFVAYLFERRQNSARLEFGEDVFVFLLLLLLMISIHTIERNQPDRKKSQLEGRLETVHEFRSNDSAEIMNQEEKSQEASYSNNSIGSDELISLLETKSQREETKIEGENDGINGDPTPASNKILEEILLSDDGSGTSDKSSSEMDIDLTSVPLLSHSENDILNSNQTLEFKGIMTSFLLIYKLTFDGSHDILDYSSDQDKVDLYYNISQVFSTSFLFLTGYSHTMQLFHSNDYSSSHALRKVYRFNLGAIFLSLSLGKSYMFYNACGIHTYFFLLLFFTMGWKKKVNASTRYGLRIKVAIMALFIFAVWDCELGFWTFSSLIFGSPSAQVHGTLWEFYYFSFLHHWAGLIGLLFAMNRSVTSLYIRRLEAFGGTTTCIPKILLGFILLGMMAAWVCGPLNVTKYTYNATNPYFGFLPTLFFVCVRNATSQFREHTLCFFQQVGVLSLEIYLLHNHVLLGNDGKTRVILLPGYPGCNAILTMTMLVYLANSLKRATDAVIDVLVTKAGDQYCFRNVLLLAGSVTLAYISASTLFYLQLATQENITTASIVCGMLGYQAILDASNLAQHGLEVTRSRDSTLARIAPPLFGTAVLVLLSLIWHTSPTHFSAPLPGICNLSLNTGEWVNIDGCTSYSRGIQFREFESVSYGSACHNFEWGWTTQNIGPQCRFENRNLDDIQEKFLNRHVTFIGDSAVKNLFYAVSRGLGDTEAGRYDSNFPPYLELTKQFGRSTTLTFKWAPLVADMIAKLKKSQDSSDLVVVGSGASDLLHVWATDENKQSHQAAVKRLSEVLNSFRAQSIPTVFLTPTSINTPALSTAEKRAQMSEEREEEIRNIYRESGVYNSAGLIINGTAFTRTISHQSYDGLHYPSHVYDVGAQILFNALDWLWYDEIIIDESLSPRLGAMANPILGAMVLCLILIGLVFFDSIFGFFYLVSICINPIFNSRQGDFRFKYSLKLNNIFDDIYSSEARNRKKADFHFQPSKIDKAQWKDRAIAVDFNDDNRSLTSRYSASRKNTLATINENPFNV